LLVRNAVNVAAVSQLLISTDSLGRAQAAGLATESLARALDVLVETFRSDGKVLIFGNGGSASHAQHLAAELVGQVRQRRDPLPAIALTADVAVISAIGNDFGFDYVFARQIDALGRPGDVAIAISTSGASSNVLTAVAAAQAGGLTVLALTGGPDSELVRLADVAVTTGTVDTQRIQEAHIVAIHVISEALEAWAASRATVR
jgi:phosphoheptose isomerase